MTPSITVSEAITLINESVLDFQDGLSKDTLDKIIFAVNNELQVRDYLMGLPNTFPMDTCKAFLAYISESVDGADRYSVDTVLSAYFYETEDMFDSLTYLSSALDIKSGYPLANLLQRVMSAGWPSESFVQMRNELHPKVLEEIAEIADQQILVEAQVIILGMM